MDGTKDGNEQDNKSEEESETEKRERIVKDDSRGRKKELVMGCII